MVGAGEQGEARGVDDVVVAVAVDDEGVAAFASWRAAMTLRESHCQYCYHLCSSPYRDQCSQHHRSLCAHVHYVETVPAVELACPYLGHWSCQ